MKHLTWILVCCLVAACVTESTGGLPKPAPKAERAVAQLAVARGYIGAANWGNAKRALEKVVALDSSLVETYVLYGVIYEAEEEYELAERNYQKALRMRPNDSQTLNNYGTYLYRRGRAADAVKYLQRVVKDTEYRARPQAYENLGLVELTLKNLPAAQAAFERAVSLNAGQAVSVLELAYMAYERHDLATAVAQYDQFRNLAKPTARSLCLGMKLGVAVGNDDQVASAALALKNLFPNSREAQSCQVQSQ
jgi:type IV pilus assembly protein PilF